MKTLLFALLAGVLIFNVAGCGQGSGRGYHLKARFRNVRQLTDGDSVIPVVMAGVRVGQVTEITLDQANATFIVTMEMKGSVVVRTDCIATIKASGSAGKSVIALDGGSPRGIALKEGQFLMAAEQPSTKDAAMSMNAGCENLLKAYLGVPPDARDWAKRNPKTLPGGATLEAMLTSLSDAGAQEIIVFTNVPSYDYLIILTLPSEVAPRQKVFTSDARLREVCGLEPIKDYGQKYLGYPFRSTR